MGNDIGHPELPELIALFVYQQRNPEAVEVARAPGVNHRRSAHKTATHISVDLVIVLFRVDVTCHTSRVTVTCHNVCCI